MMLLYLGLGTNLGDKECNLRIAVNKIEERIGKVISLFAFYVTAPWGFFSANSFLNAVVCVQTVLTPEQALAVSQTIETDMGRTVKSVQGQYHDRLIDIDLLLYGDLILDTPTLKLPHPLMHKRRFVMEPMAEIAPSVWHPVLKETMKGIWIQMSKLNELNIFP